MQIGDIASKVILGNKLPRESNDRYHGLKNTEVKLLTGVQYMPSWANRCSVILLLLHMVTVNLKAQPQVTRLGGEGWDVATSACLSIQGDLFVVCTTSTTTGVFAQNTENNNNVCVIRIDTSGKPLWSSPVCGLGPVGYLGIQRTQYEVTQEEAVSGASRYASPTSIQPAMDGGCVVATPINARLKAVNGCVNCRSEILVAKLDNRGRIQWVNTLGGTDDDVPTSMCLADDSGWIVTGYTASYDDDFQRKGPSVPRQMDMFVMKVNEVGEKEWSKTYGGSWDDAGTAITLAPEGGYFVTGWTMSNTGDFKNMQIGSHDIFVFKLDRQGDTVWKRVYGGNGMDRATSIVATTDGGVVIAGTRWSKGAVYNAIMGFLFGSVGDGSFKGMSKGYLDAFVMKVDRNGELSWVKTYGGDEWDEAISVTVSSDGKIKLTGWTWSDDADFETDERGTADIFVITLDQQGNQESKRIFAGSREDWSRSILTDDYGRVYVIGNTFSDDGDYKDEKMGHSDMILIRMND